MQNALHLEEDLIIPLTFKLCIYYVQPVVKVSPVRVRPVSDGRQTVIDVASPTTSEDLDHLKALDEQQKRRDQEPLRYCRLVAEHPVRSFRKYHPKLTFLAEDNCAITPWISV